MHTLIFYTTSGCHLCEKAEKLMEQVTEPIVFNTIDIADNDRLIELYGTKIPVIYNENSQQSLEWPFTLDELIQFSNQP